MGAVMKILITGAEGQLGRQLCDTLDNQHDLLATDLEELDVRDLSQIRQAMDEWRPDCVVHLAAMTQVDLCEAQAERAFDINALGSQYLALAAADVGAEMVTISTDYVFDGLCNRPYQPYDTPAPLNIYGWSKLHGERAVRDLLPRHYILRTSGLFGSGGTNFVSAILGKKRTGERFSVVADQRCRPTYAGHLAESICRVIGSGNYGLYHVASAGETTWFEFARAIVEQAGGDPEMISPTAATELALPAKRPLYSVLDTRSFENTFGYLLPPWQNGLDDYFEQVR
jgi:dTDP-4-dehydrorhamnose reductase